MTRQEFTALYLKCHADARGRERAYYLAQPKDLASQMLLGLTLLPLDEIDTVTDSLTFVLLSRKLRVTVSEIPAYFKSLPI